MVFIGTAGWSIPAVYAAAFPEGGTHLARYGARLTAVEINSSFYRPHQRKTYERWAASVPADFHFSVKLPRTITHDRRLAGCDALLARFVGEASGLGEKLGVLLVQLPPSLAYDAETAAAFFGGLRAHTTANIACEPRHKSWFTPQAGVALKDLRVARVAADPSRAAGDGAPGGWPGFAYWRMHGSPRIYTSNYGPESLAALAARLGQHDWCIFDNTAAFAALGNAMTLRDLAGA